MIDEVTLWDGYYCSQIIPVHVCVCISPQGLWS